MIIILQVFVLLVAINSIKCEFYSTHWQNGTTDFLRQLENSRVKSVYIPFKHNFPLFDISMEKINVSGKSVVLAANIDNVRSISSTTTVKPTLFSTTTIKSTTVDAPRQVKIPIPTNQQYYEDSYVKCENLLKVYVNDNEALKFEVRVYAIQLANVTVETKDLKSKMILLEKRNLDMFMKHGLCVNRMTGISNELKNCKFELYHN